MPRAATYLVVTVLLLAASPLAPKPDGLRAAFWVFALALAMPLALGRRPRISATIEVDRREVSIGERLTATLTLEADRWVPLAVAELDVSPAFETERLDPVVVTLHPRTPLRVMVPLTARQRGVHPVATVRGAAIGPDGLWAVCIDGEGVCDEGSMRGPECRVLTRLVPVRRWAAPRSRPYRLAGDFTSPVAGRGFEFAGIRPFAPGDSPRHIHWRSTLAQDEVMVAERLRERHATFLILVDALVDVPLLATSTLELTLEAAASLAESLLRGRHRVGVLVYGGTLGWLRPAAGTAQVRRVLDYLSGVRAFQSYVTLNLGGLPESVVPRESSVVAVSPLLDGRAAVALADLRRRGHPVWLLYLDTAARLREWAAAAPKRRMALELWELEQELAMRRLQKVGVRLARWDGSHPLDPVLAGMGGRIAATRERGPFRWPS